MTAATEAVLDEVLASHCTACGTELPRPGTRCACGQIPAVVREEAAELLAQPGVMARLEAEKLHKQAAVHLDQAQAAAAQADRQRAAAVLEEHAVTVRLAIEEAAAQVSRARQAAAQARQAHEATLPVLAEARRLAAEAVSDAEYAARTRKGPAAEIEAEVRAHKAREIVARYQPVSDHALAGCREAEAELADADEQLAVAERARDQLNAIRNQHAASVSCPVGPERLILLARPLLALAAETEADASRQDERDLLSALVELLAGHLGILTAAEKGARESGAAAALRELAGKPLAPAPYRQAASRGLLGHIPSGSATLAHA